MAFATTRALLAIGDDRFMAGALDDLHAGVLGRLCLIKGQDSAAVRGTLSMCCQGVEGSASIWRIWAGLRCAAARLRCSRPFRIEIVVIVIVNCLA
jgi:hypothetical protein